MNSINKYSHSNSGYYLKPPIFIQQIAILLNSKFYRETCYANRLNWDLHYDFNIAFLIAIKKTVNPNRGNAFPAPLTTFSYTHGRIANQPQ